MMQKRFRQMVRGLTVAAFGLAMVLTGVSADAAQSKAAKKRAVAEARKPAKATKLGKAAKSGKLAKADKKSKSLSAARKKTVLSGQAGKRVEARLSPMQASPKVLAAPSVASNTTASASSVARGGRWVAGGVTMAAASAAAADPLGDKLGLHSADVPVHLNSNAALVLDQKTHEVLLSKNDRAVLPIASLTKLMTGLLIAEARLPMDETIQITDDDVDRLKNSGSRLAVGSRLTRGEALHLALMSSENRAAHALARTYPGGVERFVRLMNQKAAELGMKDTRYADPTGLSSSNQSSARDLALLVSTAHERPLLRELSTSPSYGVDTGRRVLQYRNSNRLVHAGDWDIGLQKTGYTKEAGRCLVMQVQVSGRPVIMVLLDAADSGARISDAVRMRRWLESTQHTKKPGSGNNAA